MTDDKHRESFERWATGQQMDLSKEDDGLYEKYSTQSDWYVWQAAMRYRDEQELANRNAAEPLCVKCGNPTMHIGNVCYACIHSEQEDKA